MFTHLPLRLTNQSKLFAQVLLTKVNPRVCAVSTKGPDADTALMGLRTNDDMTSSGGVGAALTSFVFFLRMGFKSSRGVVGEGGPNFPASNTDDIATGQDVLKVINLGQGCYLLREYLFDIVEN